MRLTPRCRALHPTHGEPQREEDSEAEYFSRERRSSWEWLLRSPPPRLFPHKLEALLASSSSRQAQQIRASTDSVFCDDVPTYLDF